MKKINSFLVCFIVNGVNRIDYTTDYARTFSKQSLKINLFLITIVIYFIIILILLFFNDLKPDFSNIFLLSIFFQMILFSFLDEDGAVFNNDKYSLINITIILHEIIPLGYKKRKSLILNKLREMKVSHEQHVFEQRELQNEKENGRLSAYVKDVDYFAEMFSRKEPSFKIFLKEIIKDSSSKESICLWLHCIPRNYSLDTTKALIVSNRIYEYNLYKLKILLNSTEKEFRFNQELYKDYSEKQIKRLFSVNFIAYEYINSMIILQNYTRAIPVFTTVGHLVDFVSNSSYSISNNLFYLNQIENNPKISRVEDNPLGKISFKVIEDMKGLNFWGNSLCHCIVSYFEKCYKGEVFLLGVYKDDKPYANIEITNNVVSSMKGFSNSQVEECIEISKHINKILFLNYINQ